MSERGKVLKRRVEDLAPFEGNPRAMTPEARKRLARSMAKWGDLSGVIFNRRTGRLVGGHQRREHLPEDAEVEILEAWEEPNAVGTVAVGWIEVENERWTYREVDVSESTEKAMNLAANRHGEGAWDLELLPTMLEEIEEEDVGLTGFTEEELSDLGFGVASLDPEEAFGNLSGAKEPFREITFTVHEEQVEKIRAGLNAAKRAGAREMAGPNDNSNGNALFWLARAFLEAEAEG